MKFVCMFIRSYVGTQTLVYKFICVTCRSIYINVCINNEIHKYVSFSTTY